MLLWETLYISTKQDIVDHFKSKAVLTLPTEFTQLSEGTQHIWESVPVLAMVTWFILQGNNIQDKSSNSICNNYHLLMSKPVSHRMLFLEIQLLFT